MYRIPEPSLIKTDRFLLMHYADRAKGQTSIGDLKHLDYLVHDVVKFGLYSEDEEFLKTLIYVGGVRPDSMAVQYSMVIEVMLGRVVVQLGPPRVIDLILSQQKKRRMVQFKRPPTIATPTFPEVLESLYQHTTNNSKEVSSIKQVMRHLKSYASIDLL